MTTLPDSCRLHVNIIYILISFLLCASVGNFIFTAYLSRFDCSTLNEADLRNHGYEKIREDDHASVNSAQNRKKRESEEERKCEFKYYQSGFEKTELCFKYSSFESCCKEATNFFTGKKSGICPSGMKGMKGDFGKDRLPGDREITDCIIDGIDEPESLNLQELNIYKCLTLMVDPFRNESDTEFFIWIYENSLNNLNHFIYNLTEYKFITPKEREIIHRRILPENLQIYGNLYGVMYNGSLYSENQNRTKIAKYNMATNETIMREIGHKGLNISFHTDENGVWVIYYSLTLKNYVVINVNPENLEILSIKIIPKFGNYYKLEKILFAFGRIYYLDLNNMKINFIFDVYDRTSENISLNLPKADLDTLLLFGVSYNYKSQYLYMYDYANRVTPKRYKLRFKC